MSTENGKDRKKMRLFVQERSEDVDRLIKETEERLSHTRAFLESIEEKEEKTRVYLSAMMADLEAQLGRLRGKEPPERMAND